MQSFEVGANGRTPFAKVLEKNKVPQKLQEALYKFLEPQDEATQNKYLHFWGTDASNDDDWYERAFLYGRGKVLLPGTRNSVV